LGMTLGSPPSITATTEFVVPKSIPIIFAIAAPTGQSSCERVCLSLALESSVVKVSDAAIHQMDSSIVWDQARGGKTQI
jgi:hypothetical protein